MISFTMPGDFCAMHVAVLARTDRSIATHTDAAVVTIPRQQMEELVEVRPDLAGLAQLAGFDDNYLHRRLRPPETASG